MNDAFSVRRVQRIGNFDSQIEQQLHIERPARNPMLQRDAFQKFHRDERVAVLLADFVDGADVGMVQRGSGAGLAAETLQSLRIARNIFRQEFQSNEAAEFGIFRFVNNAHAPAAQFFQDAVMSNRAANRRLRFRHEWRTV